MTAVAMLGALAALPVAAGDWRLAVGEQSLEGISVDATVAGGEFHLSLASETAVLRFSFPAPDGARPGRAEALRVSVTAFEPALSCGGAGDAGVRLEGNRLSGQIACREPAAVVDIDGTFNPD